MAENDIYDSRRTYEKTCKKIECWVAPPINGNRKYWIKNPDNLRHFERLVAKLEARDISYIRRIRLIRKLIIVCHIIQKNLKDAKREDIDEVLAYAHTIHKTFESKRDFLLDLRFLWKILFPDLDEYGREDETIVPYVVRHVSTKIDLSRKKIRGDKLTPEEYRTIFDGFFDRPDIQAIITLGYEGLGRPQEILARKISDVEIHDTFAKVWITEHGKEGTGFIPIIDGVETLRKWVERHPLKQNPDAPLFFSRSDKNMFAPISPAGVNKVIRTRVRHLGIQKRITLYSFKRNGVTHMRLAGYSDNQIQRRARWTTTKQLHTYDLGNQEDAFDQELRRRGLNERNITPAPSAIRATVPMVSESKSPAFCSQCGSRNSESDSFCSQCGKALRLSAAICTQHPQRIYDYPPRTWDRNFHENPPHTTVCNRSPPFPQEYPIRPM